VRERRGPYSCVLWLRAEGVTRRAEGGRRHGSNCSENVDQTKPKPKPRRLERGDNGGEWTLKLSHYPLETQEGYRAIGNWLKNALVRVRIRIRVRVAVWVGKKVGIRVTRGQRR
jgi:hypothetical protein